MAKQSSTFTVIVVIVIIVLIVSPQIFGGFGDLISRGWEAWQGLWPTEETSTEEGEGGINEGSYSTFGITIMYADGTERYIEPEGLLIFPLTIYDGVKPVISLRVDCFGEVSMTGTVSSWQADGWFRVMLMTDSFMVIGNLYDETIPTQTGSTWTDGERKQLYTRDCSATDIENMLTSSGYESGDYVLKLLFGLDSVQMTFTDGTSDTEDAISYCTAAWNFQYSDAGISSVTLSISHNSV